MIELYSPTILKLVKRLALVLAALFIVAYPSIVSAQSAYDSETMYDIIQGSSHYNPYDCGGSSGTTASTGPVNVAPASDNEKSIWNWLVGQGLSGAAAAGIMGNIMQESDFDPTIVQGGGDSSNPASAGSNGWGLFQWTPGAKVLQDQAGAKATGDITAIATQMMIMWWEAQGNGQWAGEGNTIAKIQAVSGNDNTAAEQVASIFVNDFEHAGIVGPRGANADSILATAKQQNWPDANATSSTGGSGSTTGGGNTSTTSASGAATSCCQTTTTTASSLGTFSSLTGDDAISGTFILGFQASTNKSDIEAIFKKYKPAGMYILGTTDAAGAGFNSAFYQALATDAGHPIIAASDEEGLFTRYKYNFNFPSAGAMSTMSTTQVQSIGKQVAQAMTGNGLNTDLAPVLDVGTGDNADFHSQANRTFGTNAATVTSKAGAFAAGLYSGGIRPVYKHFPGLGSSSGDTDTQSVTSPSLAQLENSDLKPYSQLANQNGAAVMMDNAHIPGLTGADVASTSAAAVSLLRNKYAFSGLILTDDLIATGVGLPPATALATALEAGVNAPLETYQSDAVLDSAIAQAKAANVNTQSSLKLLDSFVPKPATVSTTGSNSNSTGCCPSTAAAPAPSTGPLVKFYDATTDSAIPDLTHAATYSTSFQESSPTAIRIAQSASESTDVAAASSSNALDIEPMAASPSFVASFVQARSKVSNGIVLLYEDTADLPAVKASVATLPANLQSQVRYWVADLGSEAVRPAGVWGTQYAWGSTYDTDVTTQAGWSEILSSPPTSASSGTSTSVSTCVSTTAGSGKMINPFPGGWIPNRLDMGYDGTFKGDIVAPFNGTIQYSGPTQGWNGSLMVVIKASGNVGLPNSQSLYFTEGVKPLVPNNGETVTAGTPIAAPYPSPYGDAYATTADGSGQIEWGEADQTAPAKQMPNTEAVILGINGTCSPSKASQAMVLGFYAVIKTVVPGTATTEQCAGAP